jgi:hypothetical protein
VATIFGLKKFDRFAEILFDAAVREHSEMGLRWRRELVHS